MAAKRFCCSQPCWTVEALLMHLSHSCCTLCEHGCAMHNEAYGEKTWTTAMRPTQEGGYSAVHGLAERKAVCSKHVAQIQEGENAAFPAG